MSKVITYSDNQEDSSITNDTQKIAFHLRSGYQLEVRLNDLELESVFSQWQKDNIIHVFDALSNHYVVHPLNIEYVQIGEKHYEKMEYSHIPL